MEGKSNIKKWFFLENGWTDFDEQNICFSTKKLLFEEKSIFWIKMGVKKMLSN